MNISRTLKWKAGQMTIVVSDRIDPLQWSNWREDIDARERPALTDRSCSIHRRLVLTQRRTTIEIAVRCVSVSNARQHSRNPPMVVERKYLSRRNEGPDHRLRLQSGMDRCDWRIHSDENALEQTCGSDDRRVTSTSQDSPDPPVSDRQLKERERERVRKRQGTGAVYRERWGSSVEKFASSNGMRRCKVDLCWRVHRYLVPPDERHGERCPAVWTVESNETINDGDSLPDLDRSTSPSIVSESLSMDATRSATLLIDSIGIACSTVFDRVPLPSWNKQHGNRTTDEYAVERAQFGDGVMKRTNEKSIAPLKRRRRRQERGIRRCFYMIETK